MNQSTHKETVIAGGCSFTYGNELSDDFGKTYSLNTWSSGLSQSMASNYFCVAKGGLGNSGIARRVFDYISNNNDENPVVVIMWSFLSRYDWAMARNSNLEHTRWATITPWDTALRVNEVEKTIGNSEPVMKEFKRRQDLYNETGIGAFADSLYKHAANEYHEAYLSWKSIVWLQNILEKRKIPFMFTLADNSLFYDTNKPLWKEDQLLTALYNEIDFTRWFSFGDRMMGFNQWAKLNEYEYATTHPLDEAHRDAVKLMKGKFEECLKR